MVDIVQYTKDTWGWIFYPDRRIRYSGRMRVDAGRIVMFTVLGSDGKIGWARLRAVVEIYWREHGDHN